MATGHQLEMAEYPAPMTPAIAIIATLDLLQTALLTAEVAVTEAAETKKSLAQHELPAYAVPDSVSDNWTQASPLKFGVRTIAQTGRMKIRIADRLLLITFLASLIPMGIIAGRKYESFFEIFLTTIGGALGLSVLLCIVIRPTLWILHKFGKPGHHDG